jgi:hypothetical protein
MLDGQLTRIDLVPCRKLQEELEAIAVAVKRMDAHRPLSREIIG